MWKLRKYIYLHIIKNEISDIKNYSRTKTSATRKILNIDPDLANNILLLTLFTLNIHGCMKILYTEMSF